MKKREFIGRANQAITQIELAANNLEIAAKLLRGMISEIWSGYDDKEALEADNDRLENKRTGQK